MVPKFIPNLKYFSIKPILCRFAGLLTFQISLCTVLRFLAFLSAKFVLVFRTHVRVWTLDLLMIVVKMYGLYH